MEKKEHLIHIIVEVSKTDHRRIEFDKEEVTGAEIKVKARVPLESDLALKKHGELVLVTNDEKITIKSGEHFCCLPSGTIS